MKMIIYIMICNNRRSKFIIFTITDKNNKYKPRDKELETWKTNKYFCIFYNIKITSTNPQHH